MTKRRNRIIFISILAVIVISFITILCIFLTRGDKLYKYSGRIYEDSYDFKDNYGYKYLKEKNEEQANLYEELYLTMTDFSHRYLETDIKTCKHLFYKEDKNNNTLTQDEISQVFIYINIENPKFYWLTYDFDEDGLLQFGICRRYSEKSVRKKNDKIINNGLKKVDKVLEGIEDEFDKIKAIYDYIVNNMKYAYDESGKPSEEQWAHNILGFFERNEGVCETYAKTFKLLCDRYNIKNIPVVSNDHIWNLVLYEEKWYIFDLTWDDGGYIYFGKTEKIYEIDSVDRESHEYDPLLYPLPDNMANTPLSFGIIDLKEDGNTIYSSHSMDSIFKHFNNGKYEIVLNKSEAEALDNFYISYIDSRYNTLTIFYNNGENKNAIINVEMDIYLNKDITFMNLYFNARKGKKIILNGNTIYLKNITFGTLVSIEGENIVYLD